MKNKIEQHKKDYIHIRKDIAWKIPLTLVSIGLAVLFMFVIINSWNFLGLTSLYECEESCGQYSYSYQLMIIPLLLLEYGLISISICLSVLCFKRKLKPFKEVGLIGGLIVGLILGLIVGLIVGLIGGLIGGLIYGLIWGLIVGLIVGLIYGLIWGLIYGLIWGLIEEAKKE